MGWFWFDPKRVHYYKPNTLENMKSKRLGLFMVYLPSTGYTQFTHASLEEAVKEAKRLQSIHGQTFEILQIIAEIEEVEVPVVRKEQKLTLADGVINNDLLPF